MDSIEDIYNKRILINRQHYNANKWTKLKYRVFDFLYNQYKEDVIKKMKNEMWKEYRISHQDDNISYNKFLNYCNEYLVIMDIDYKTLYTNKKKWKSEKERLSPYVL